MAKRLCLGVTGLRRSGKTVFISALVNMLVNGGRRNGISCVEEGRFLRAYVADIKPFPSIKKFRYDSHIDKILYDQKWPDITKNISALRVTIEYKLNYLPEMIGTRRTHIDIVDYPGEWLLDLPLMSRDYIQWSSESIEQSNKSFRKSLAENWHKIIQDVDPNSNYNSDLAENLVSSFRSYLKKCREDERTISRMPPGRFLEPDELKEGDERLFFAPLITGENMKFNSGSIGARFERNFEHYKEELVEPFFTEYFSKLDRQIVLIDALPAISSGNDSISDLRHSMSQILNCFSKGTGKINWLDRILFKRKIDRVLFAATKVDHILSSNHRNYQNILEGILHNSYLETEDKNIGVKIEVLASVRSTTEGTNKESGKVGLRGTPMKGEKIGGIEFDGETVGGYYPNKFPDSIDSLYSGEFPQQFIKFRPIKSNVEKQSKEVPHIGLDRAIEFLIGDKLT